MLEWNKEFSFKVKSLSFAVQLIVQINSVDGYFITDGHEYGLRF